MYYDTYAQEDTVKPLLEVTKTALLHDCTLLCAWRVSVYYINLVICISYENTFQALCFSLIPLSV